MKRLNYLYAWLQDLSVIQIYNISLKLLSVYTLYAELLFHMEGEL